MPSRNDSRNDPSRRCGVCGQAFSPLGRRRWCSDACRQAAWRRRHPAPPPETPPVPPGRPRPGQTIYECPDCGERLAGSQYCSDCATFARRIGPGGLCPHCDEPVAIKDLVTP